MKNIKKTKSSENPLGNDNTAKRKTDSSKTKSTIGPEEFEEQRSMNIRMKEQPFQSSKKGEKQKNQK